MALAKSSDPRGLKRICLNCSTRFYDMNKRPIICPNCSVEFTGEVKVKARRGRLSALEDVDPVLGTGQVEAAEATDELEDEEDTKEVSLDEVAAADDAGDDDDDTAIDLDEDLDDADLDDDIDDDDDLDVDIEEDDK